MIPARNGCIPRVGYLGLGAHLPDRVLTNAELEEVVDTSDDWIRRRTGIQTRRLLERDESVLDMAVSAARRALADAGVDPADIRDIRVGVNTWMRFPSLATQVQKELGCPLASAADVSAGCAGFIYAVEQAYHRILVEKTCYDRDLLSLVIGVDGLSHITDWTDRSTCVLLGDGAGAVVLGAVDHGGILATHTHAQGQYGHLLYSTPVLESPLAEQDQLHFREDRSVPRPFLRMDGPRVYAIAIRTMVQEVHDVIALHNSFARRELDVEDIGFVYPHQANLRIIEGVAQALKLPLERIYHDGVRKFGNTSTASIPIGYCDQRRADSGPPHDEPGYEIDVAFGAGFASGAILREIA